MSYVCTSWCFMHTWSLLHVLFHIAGKTLVNKTSWSQSQQVLQFSVLVVLASTTWSWLKYPGNVFWEMLNSFFQIWQLKIGLMLLQGAQRVVYGNKAACLEQNTWTLSLKYALCEALACLYPKRNHYSFLVISKRIRSPFCMCENVLSFLIVSERRSVWLGKGLEGCPYHLLHPFVSLVRLHSCISNWKKNGKCVRIMILAFKAERKNWEEVLQESFLSLPACSSWWCWV